MQKFYIVLSMLLLILVAVFAVSNNDIVSVNLFGLAQLKSTLAVMILVCFVSGAFLMAIFDLGKNIRAWKKIRTLEAQLKKAEEEMERNKAALKRQDEPRSVGWTENGGFKGGN